jgi:hypothetical protein
MTRGDRLRKRLRHDPVPRRVTFRIGQFRTWARSFFAVGGFAMKSFATGLSVQAFKVTMPIDARTNGSSTCKTLSSERLVGNRKADLEKIVRKRPVCSRLVRTSRVVAMTVTRG